MTGETSLGQIMQDLINHGREFELHRNFIKWPTPLAGVSKGMT